MALTPIKFSSVSSAALLLGTLAPAAFAQSDSAIVATQTAPIQTAPIQTAPAQNAPVPAKVSSPDLATSTRPLLELSFRDMGVADLLDIIAHNSDLQILVASDVSGIKIDSVNLTKVTPEAAIKYVVSVAGLKYRRLDDGTILIAKNLPPEEAPAAPAINRRVPLQPNGLPSSFGPSTFSSNAPGNNGYESVLPPLGDNGSFNSFNTGQNSDFDVPPLIGKNQVEAKKSMHPIKLKNIPSDLMAYWLDPARHVMPASLQRAADIQGRYNNPNYFRPLNSAAQGAGLQGSGSLSDSFVPRSAFNPYVQRSNSEVRSNAQFGGGGNNNGGGGGRGNNGGGNNGGRGGAGGRGAAGVFQLPEGVDQIVAIDPQNALLVFGTDEGVRELTATIAFLDRPLRQVEIEAQFVSVNTNDSRSFGIDYSAAQGNFNFNGAGFASAPASTNGSVQIGYVRGNFQATLSALVSQQKAKVITAPRVTAINNLTATLESTTISTVVLTTVAQGIGGGQLQGQTGITITTTIGLTVTPTINNDDTVTVLMEPTLTTQTPVPNQNTFPTINSQTVQTIANVRDGDTIALGGLKAKTVTRSQDKIPVLSSIPIFGRLFKNNGNITTENDLIIFLTARILRRAGDDDAVPGT